MTAGRPAGADPADGRALARWWDGLAALRPRALWAGHLDLTHLDALARVVHPEPLDPLHRLLLRAVEAAAPATPDALDARLGLGRAPLARWLGDLEAAGLVRAADGGFALTAAGGTALASGAVARPAWERRRFTFADVPGAAPHFLPWAAEPGSGGRPENGSPADVRWLAEGVARPAAWKERFGFPADVAGVEPPDPAGAGRAAWRRVAVAHAERVPVALALAAPDGGPERLFGFVVHGGDVAPDAPALRLDAGWEEPFPELARDPDPAELRAAWRERCAALGLSAADADACGLEWIDGRLRVQTPMGWGEHGVDSGWLLVGGGRLRRAVEWTGARGG
jgi:hypothetical protein